MPLSSIWLLPALLPSALGSSLHPLPADVFLENLRSDVNVPHSQIAYWDDLVDPRTSQRGILSINAALKRLLASEDLSPKKVWSTFVASAFPSAFLPHRLKPTCSSLEGPVCNPLEDSPMATSLIDSKGLQDDTLYHDRIRNILKQTPPPHPLTQKRWTQLINEHASAESLSALLPTLRFPSATGRVVVPLTDRYFDLRSSPDRVQTSGRAVSNVSVRVRRPFAETAAEHAEGDRARNEHNRAWYHFGASPPSGLTGVDKSSSSLSPDRVLVSRSYTSHDWDNPQTQPHQYEALLMPLSLQADDAVAQGLSWLRNSPLPPSTAGEHLWENAYVDESALNSTVSPTMIERMALYNPLNRLPQALAEVVEDDQAILRHLDRQTPNKWKMYAAAMGVHPLSIRKWLSSKDTVKPMPVMTKGKQALTNSLIANTSIKSYFHPLAITRFLFMLEHTIIANVGLLVSKVLKAFVNLAATSFGIEEELPWLLEQQRLANVTASLNETPLTDESKQSNLSTSFGEDGDTAIIDELTQEYQAMLTPVKHVIEYSRWTGNCWFWDGSQIGSMDGRHVDRHSSGGLPPTMLGGFRGFWHQNERSGSRHPHLLSEAGEIHIDPSVTLSALWLSLETSFSRNVTQWPLDSLYELEIEGLSLAPHLNEEQIDPTLDAWRSSRQSNGVSTQWRILLSPHEWLARGVVPGSVFDVLEAGRVAEGHVHKRIDFVRISLTDRARGKEASAFINKEHRLSKKLMERRRQTHWLRAFAPRRDPSLVVKLHGIDLMMKGRIFAVDETALTEILSSQRSDPTDPVKRQEVLLRSSQFTDDFPTYADTFPTLTVATSAVSLPSDAPQLPHLPETETDADKLRLAVKERLVHYFATYPTRSMHDRLAALPNPLELGSPLTRGFGIPKAAQLADDASLIARFNLAAAEGAFRPFLLSDGVIAGFSRQLIANRFSVSGVQLGVEAPYQSLQALHRQAAILATKMSDSAFVHFTSESSPHTPPTNSSAESTFLKILSQKLVGDPALEKIAKQVKAGSKSSPLPPGKLNAALEEFENEHGPLTPDGDESRADMFVDSLVTGTGPAQQATEFDTSRGVTDSKIVLGESLAQAVAAAVRELRQVAGEDAVEAAAEQFRDLTIIALVENEETGEMITQKADIDLRTYTDPIKTPEPPLPTSPPPGLDVPQQEAPTFHIETVTSTTAPKLTQTAGQASASAPPTRYQNELEPKPSSADEVESPSNKKQLLEQRLAEFLEDTLLDRVDSMTVEEAMGGLDSSIDMAALEAAMGETAEEALDNLLWAMSDETDTPMRYETDDDVDQLQARLAERVAVLWAELNDRPEFLERMERALEQQDFYVDGDDPFDDDDDVMRIAVEMPDETGEGFIVEEFDIPRDILEDEAKLTTYFEDLGYEMGPENGDGYNPSDSDQLTNESSSSANIDSGTVLEGLRLDLGTGILEGGAF